jgi:sugar/nucleoside kinase (ribokinase family)
MRSGIIAGGNWIRDHVKVVDAWPAQDGLANIVGRAAGNGGGPYNVLKDLAKMGAPFPLAAIGLLGDDADGHAVLADCREHGIDTGLLRTMPGLRTSYTDVMTVAGTGRRTFFHDRGANASLGPGDFDFSARGERIFYLGYLMLLDRLDAPDAEGAPFARGVLGRARAEGIMTALDCVSAASGRFRATVEAVLPEVDVLFANDFEAEQITGIALGRGASLDSGAVERAAGALIGLGVQCWSVVHFPEGACACSRQGDVVWQPSVRMPADAVAGTAGAGDALAAGVLLGFHEAWPMQRALELGACAAAASLMHATCSESVLPQGECVALGRGRGFRPPPGR